MSSTKNRRNHNQSFKLLLFTISLHFVTSNQVSRYRKTNLPLTSSIYLVVLPLEMQRRLKQTKVYHMFFYFVRKETIHKPLKVAAANTLFFNVYVIGIQLALMNMFYSMWWLENITFHKSLLLLWEFFNRTVVGFFGASVLKAIRTLCVFSKITVRLLIPKFQNKVDYAL